ncbi:MAG: TraR/DksA C4-type zinc finger protein [Geminicoccaceae bacterium]|nr:TraR/DksA C4-type zinc finger protein [Geminicoccaceae bacterium]
MVRGQVDLAAIRQRLEAELEELQESSEHSEEARRPVTVDQPSVGRLSRMDALQEQAMAMATEERRQQRRQRIGAALERMERGEYGECVRCGEDIAPKRLDLDPSVPTCLTCAGAAE